MCADLRHRLQRIRQYLNHAVRANLLWDALRRIGDSSRRCAGVPSPCRVTGRRRWTHFPDTAGEAACVEGSPCRRHRHRRERRRPRWSVSRKRFEVAGVTPVAYGVCLGSALRHPAGGRHDPREVALATQSLHRVTSSAGLAGFVGGTLAAWEGVGSACSTETDWSTPIARCSAMSPSGTAHSGLAAHLEHRAQSAGLPRAGYPSRSQRGPRRPHGCRATAGDPTNHLDGGWWLDGGVVDILPAEPFVGTDRADLAIVVNGFYLPASTATRSRAGGNPASVFCGWPISRGRVCSTSSSQGGDGGPAQDGA